MCDYRIKVDWIEYTSIYFFSFGRIRSTDFAELVRFHRKNLFHSGTHGGNCLFSTMLNSGEFTLSVRSWLILVDFYSSSVSLFFFSMSNSFCGRPRLRSWNHLERKRYNKIDPTWSIGACNCDFLRFRIHFASCFSTQPNEKNRTQTAAAQIIIPIMSWVIKIYSLAACVRCECSLSKVSLTRQRTE